MFSLFSNFFFFLEIERIRFWKLLVLLLFIMNEKIVEREQQRKIKLLPVKELFNHSPLSI